MIHEEFEEPYFEILRDEREDALANGIKRNENHHIIHSDWAEWLNKRMGRKDLFVYRHRQTENFVLAAWMYRDTEIFTELETSPISFDRGGWKQWDYMRFRLRPKHEIIRDMRENRARRERLEKQKQENNREMRDAAVKYQKGKGAYMDPHSSYNYDPDSQLTESLIEMSKMTGKKHFS